jgi:hypothetical protein
MATKKDSVQEERIQNVCAPRSEPGAPNASISRRDLLTGGALVLVGTASGCDGCPQPLRTPFIAAFTATFIGDPNTIKPLGQSDSWPDPSRIWPKSDQSRVQIVADYETFANVLLTAGYLLAPPPTTAPGLQGQIAQFLVAQNWPAVTTPPPQYQGELPTVHLVEISVILDRLLQAMNSFNPGTGAGGSGSNWPPH